MCGIAGFLIPQTQPSAADVVRRMVATIRHRGPDDAGVFVDPHVALGHARLSIIDIGGGHQPMQSADGTLQIVFNGEIFNHVELREELTAKGHHFTTRSDTDVILHMFQEYGEDCVTRFNGQWAFAIWNTRTRRLFLSRDRMGVRPLFYTWVNGAFVFASEIKALQAYPGVSREIDLAALDQVFTFWHTLAPRTAFKEISELPPGHSAMIAGGHCRTWEYWDARYHPREGVSEDELAAQLSDLLDDAANIRLRSDVPVGAYLSGGIDSTVIAGMAKRHVGDRLRTFSVRFEDADFDEGAYQKAAVDFLGSDHAEICCSDRDIGTCFPDVIRHTESPVLRTAPAPLFRLSQLVRDSGYKVVLTGEGADEVLGGYDIFKETKIRSFWARHPESTWRPLLLKRLYPYLPNVQSQSAAYLGAFFDVRRPDAGGPLFSHLPRWRQREKLDIFFSGAAKAEASSVDRLAELTDRLPTAFKGWGAFEKAQYLETRGLLPGYILSSQGDRVAMAHSVEGRYPFLDHRVVEFASQLPSRLKMKVLREKYLLKRAAGDLVPPAILRRHKQPYRAPDARSFFPKGPKLDYVWDLLSPAEIRKHGVFNPTSTGKLLDKAARGELTGNRDNMAFVGILSTQILLHSFAS